jgi:predicted ATP-grasp superfamily ATP-dependent carboligase
VTGGGFELGGCAINLPDPDRADAERLAAAVATAMPGLWGYAGIDFLQTGTGPVVLEVNPRLTTSYVGLRAALGINVAARVLDLWMTGELPSGDLPRGKTVQVLVGDRHAG